MELTIFQVNLSDLTKLKSLRMNVSYYSPDEKANKLLKKLEKKYALLSMRQIISHVTQGPRLRLMDSNSSGDVGILSIENIDDSSVELLSPECFFHNDDVPNRRILKEGTILTPRVRKIGNVGLVRKGSFIASENVLVIRLDVKKLKKYNLQLEFVAYYLSLVGKYQLQILRTGGEAGNLNQWLVQEVMLPLVPSSSQEEIMTKMEKANRQIIETRQRIISLQQIIDRSFSKYDIKRKKSRVFSTENFSSSLRLISNQKYLRCGVKYRWFWDVNDGKLFDSTSGDNSLVKLSSLIKPYDCEKVKKGILNEERILVELDDVESRTGRIVNEEAVDEIGSDKIVFGECDLLTTKLRPYLGYTILNDPSKDYIGTTELIPFQVKGETLPSFIKYMLLSEDYLEKSRFLMYGKEHPRMHIDDVLNIKVPNISPCIQEIVVKEIEKAEKANNEIRDYIKQLKSEAEKTFLKELGL